MYRMNAPLGQLLIVDDEPSAPTFCPAKSGMCISARLKEVARTKCWAPPRVRGYSTRGMEGLGLYNASICSNYSQVTQDWLFKYYNPCHLKDLPVCPPLPAPPPPPAQPFDEPDPPPVDESEPPPVEEEEDDNNIYVIGGILAVIIVGGVGYSVWRNRKKKRGSRK